MKAFNVLAALFALYQLVRHGRQALLFLAPGLARAEADPEEGPRTLGQVRAGEALAGLGFLRLGAIVEHGVLGGHLRDADAWAHAGEGAYADVLAGGAAGDRGAVRVELRSVFPDGATVVTANHPRLAIAAPGVQAGAIPGASVEALLAAHRHAVSRFGRTHGVPQALPDLRARLDVTRAWQQGPGRGELRRRYAMPFANACFALLLLAGSVHVLMRSVR